MTVAKTRILRYVGPDYISYENKKNCFINFKIIIFDYEH